MVTGKLCKPSADAAECSISSESTLLYKYMFVCVKFLLPSQPNGVISRVVSLPTHTFTGQA